MACVEVSVITNSDRYIFACLESLVATWTREPEELVMHIVANPATEDIINRLRTAFPDAHIWENSETRGFAANHNMILEQATAPFVLILNDDIVFLPHALERMVALMESQPGVGALSPKLLNADRTLQASTYSFTTLPRAMLDILGIRQYIDRLPWLLSIARLFFRKPGSSRLWAHDQTCDVHTFTGACMLVRREALKAIGLMDEVTKLYGEETEWHYRFWQSGERVVFYPEAEVIHFGMQTTLKLPPHHLVEVVKGYLNFFEKHGPRWRYRAFLGILALVWQIKFLAEYLLTDQVSWHTREILGILRHPDSIFAGKRRFYCRTPDRSHSDSRPAQAG